MGGLWHCFTHISFPMTFPFPNDIPYDIPYLVSFPTHHLDIYWGLSTINHPFRGFSIYGTPSLAIRNDR
jgi:hypothetical protein